MVVVAPMVEDGESMFVARIVVMVDVCSVIVVLKLNTILF